MTDEDSTQMTPADAEQDATLISAAPTPNAESDDATHISAAPAAADDATQISAAESVTDDETFIAAAPAQVQAEATHISSIAPAPHDSTHIASAMDDIAPKSNTKDIPESLGRYKVEKILGQGAMGVVYKGIDATIGRPVAIKTVLTSLLDIGRSEEIMARFKREAQAAGRINHPGIVSVYEFGEDGDTTFIAMEFVEGRELEELLESGHRFRAEDTVELIDHLLDALSVAHEQGVVHRDIKPANIIVTKRGIKVADFGIANLENSSMTQVGEVLGTPNYMSPEQVYGHPVDGRSDLFSVGIILYQLLTSEKPFSGGSSATVMHRVVNNEPDPPSVLNKLVPKAFDSIISKAMAKMPADRFQTAQEFQNALKGVFSGAAAPAVSTQSSGPELDAQGIPKTLGKYKIEKVLGQGAMGIVYKGIDESIQRQVAIKTILTNLLDMDLAETVLQRFKREAQAAGRLNHPNIVAVYEYGKDGETAFIAMEYVQGDELEELLEGGKRLGMDAIRDTIGQLLDALSVAHKNGVVHRDIKPANLILTENGIKVADFGIANLEDSSMTQMGEVLGTPNYMSPEQVYGQPVDGRSDLFSVGIILYQLITGEKPFSGGAAATVMHRVVNNEPEPPSILNQLIPKGFDGLISKSMAKKPEDRFQTAQEFKDALFQVCDGGSVKGVKASGANNNKGLKVAMGLVLVGGLAASGVFFAPPELLPWHVSDEITTLPKVIIADQVDKDVVVVEPEVVKIVFGYVQVSLDPEIQADVYFGDKKVGETPFRDEVEVGDYEVRISKPNYHEMVLEIEVEEGADVQLSDLTLEKM